MGAVIKSGSLNDLSSVRPFTIPSHAPAIAVVKQDEERERLQRRLMALEAELKERDAAITALRADVECALVEGKAEGMAVGRAEVEDRQAARLTLLLGSIEQCQAELSNRLESLERLSFLVTQECLDKILGDRDTSAGLVRQIIEHQIGKVDRAMLMSIEVSQEDFPDTTILEEVVRKAGARSITVSATTEIPSGGCRMRLQLGNVEVGIDQQWGVLRELLAELALPEASP